MIETDLTPKQKAGKFTALARRQNERFFIAFNCANSYDPATGRYRKYVWPILFKTHEDAETAISILPVFANSGEMPGRGRIKSCCVEKVIIGRRRRRKS